MSCPGPPSTAFSTVLQEELVSVEAILMEGVEVHGSTVTVDLHPLTASQEDKKYVFVKLELTFPEAYPEVAPKIKVTIR